MIVGEQDWIGAYNDEEYDLFFKKIRKKIRRTVKKIKPRKIFNPLGRGVGLINRLKNKPQPKQRSSAQSQALIQAQVNKNVAAKNSALETSKAALQKERAEFEQKKVQETTQLNEEKIKTEQAQLDVEQDENKRILYIGLAGLGFLVIVGGIIFFIRSRKNQIGAQNPQNINQ